MKKEKQPGLGPQDPRKKYNQGIPGVEDGSHRDEEARELDLSGYAGLVQ